MTVGGQRQRQRQGVGEGESVHKCTKNNAKAKNAKTEMIKKDMRTPKRPCPSKRPTVSSVRVLTEKCHKCSDRANFLHFHFDKTQTETKTQQQQHQVAVEGKADGLTPTLTLTNNEWAKAEGRNHNALAARRCRWQGDEEGGEESGNHLELGKIMTTGHAGSNES